MNERVERLAEARDRLVVLLVNEEDGSKAASLSREIRALEKELADLAPAEPKSKGVDQLAEKRRRRIAPKVDDSSAVQD